MHQEFQRRSQMIPYFRIQLEIQLSVLQTNIHHRYGKQKSHHSLKLPAGSSTLPDA